MLAPDLIPRNIFTEHLSRSILSIVAAYGPWSSGYGLPPLELQVTPPRSFLQVAANDINHLVCFTVGIYNPASTSSVQISKITPDQVVPVMPAVLRTGSSKATQIPPDSDVDVASNNAYTLADGLAVSEGGALLAPTVDLNDGLTLSLPQPMDGEPELGLAQVGEEPQSSCALLAQPDAGRESVFARLSL